METYYLWAINIYLSAFAKSKSLALRGVAASGGIYQARVAWEQNGDLRVRDPSYS
jgi:hypothetical protein